jgi:hypothetical protein
MSLYEILSLVIGAIGVVLTGVYVFLTLRIANKTAESVKATQESLALARDQLAINKQQSKEATDLSKAQSQAAIDAVHHQIQVSEKQNREQIENQYKPFLFPLDKPISHDRQIYEMSLQNCGAGVALNTWGLFTMRNFGQIQYFSASYLIAAQKVVGIAFVNGEIFYQQNAFEEYPLFLQGDESGIKRILRLMITYNDIFNNKFLGIFDYNEEFSWQLVTYKQVGKRLDELATRKNKS